MVKRVLGIYYRVGFWHQGEIATNRELSVKIFYSIYLFLFLFSIAIGAIVNENRDVAIYLGEVAILYLVFVSKLFILMWQQKKVEALLNRTCVFPIYDDGDLDMFHRKLSSFTKFGNALLFNTMLCICCEVAIYPFYGSKKTLALELAFPLDWREDEFSFWIGNLFMLIGAMLALAAISFGVITSYLLLVCSLRYDLLGSNMRKAGQRSTGKILNHEKQQLYGHNLITSIKEHLNLEELS